VREAQPAHRDRLQGADLHPAVGAVAGAVQHRHLPPGQPDTSVQQGGLVGLDGEQVVRALGGDQELCGLSMGVECISRDYRPARSKSANSGWKPGTSPGAPLTACWASTLRVACSMAASRWTAQPEIQVCYDLIECCVGTHNNGTLDVDPRLPETESVILFEVAPKGGSSSPGRCGSATKSAKSTLPRDGSNSSTHAVFRHRRNKGRSR
jgi:hypothetical protein